MNIIKKIFSRNNKNFITGKGCTIDNFSTFHGQSSAMQNCIIKNADIGRYVSMADFISVGVEEPDFDKISTSPRLNSQRIKKRTTIKNDVWIGVDSIIKEGVTIGNGAVVGSNTYVREDVPDFAIVGGNPAKIIKYRFNNEIRQKIIDSKYWEEEPEKAKEIVNKLQKEYDLKKEV